MKSVFSRGASQIHMDRSSPNGRIAKAFLLTIGVVLSLSLTACGKRIHHVGTGERTSKNWSSCPKERPMTSCSPMWSTARRTIPSRAPRALCRRAWLPGTERSSTAGPPQAARSLTCISRVRPTRRCPLGTHVRVANLAAKTEIIVRINDRGPFVKGRIIDLSYAAAKEVGLLGPGVAPVRIEALARQVGEVEASSG